MKKFTPLTFLAVALLFLIVVSSASELDKRTNTCPQQYKRGVLGKRTNVRKCPCALASASFTGKATGFVLFAQDECGSTTVTGFFSKGLDNPQQNNFTFAVVDECNKVIEDLGDLGAKFTDGGTTPFAQKFDNFNLNCDKNGILMPNSNKAYKRTNECNKSYYKRQTASGNQFAILSGGETYSTASFNSL